MPTRPRRRLTLPVEILNREFDAKLLVACVAAERGFSVVIGFKWEILQRMGSLPRSIYLGGNITPRNVEFCARLRQLGHTITCLDEEGLVYLNPDYYRRRRVSDKAFETVQELFAWGADNAAVWSQSPGYRENPIHLTGHPRTDFLREELRTFWDADVERLRARFGRFVLINSNFGKLNNFRGEERSEQLNAVRDPASVDEEERGMSTHRHALLEHFRPIVKDLAQAHPDTKIVVRPHPAESPEMWRRAAEGCTNVEVLHEGQIVPWLLAAAVRIHNGCTTGVESYLLGRTALAYQPVISDRFDIHLPNRLSRQVPDHDTLCRTVAEELAGTDREDPQESRERRELAEQYFASLDGPLASERIVSVLEQLDEAPATGRRPRLGTYLTGKTQVTLRRMKRNYKTFLHLGRSTKRLERHEYHRHIFPHTSVADVQSRVASLQRTLRRFENVRVRGYRGNIFELSTTRAGGLPRK